MLISIHHIYIRSMQFKESFRLHSFMTHYLNSDFLLHYIFSWFKVAQNSFLARKLCFISRISDSERYTFHVSKDYDTKTWQKSQKTFPVYKKHTYSFHVSSYIHFVALHIQNNNCAKFQRILQKDMDKFDFFPFYSTHNRGRLCCHGNRLLFKCIGNKMFARTKV